MKTRYSGAVPAERVVQLEIKRGLPKANMASKMRPSWDVPVRPEQLGVRTHPIRKSIRETRQFGLACLLAWVTKELGMQLRGPERKCLKP